VTPAVRQMFEIMSASVPFLASLALRQLLNRVLADRALALLGPAGQTIYPLIRNTYNVIARSRSTCWAACSRCTRL